MNQLSKKEYKYRYKIIYENHFTKDKQTFLDKYVQRRLLTYKTFYLNDDFFLDGMLASYRLSKLNDACAKAANSASSASEAMQAFTASITKLFRQLDDVDAR